MTFISLKVTMIFQVLVCFGIIASTVSVTRSVVQTNLANFKDHLEHLQIPPGEYVWDSSSDTEANFNDSVLFTEPRFQGWVVSNKEHRYNHSKTVLETLGIVPNQYVPEHYQSSVIQRAMEDYHSGNQKYLTDKYKKVFSNRMAFTDLFRNFVNDTTADVGQWRFFFEDDVALHPFLTPSLARRLLARGMEVAAADGILYLGICGPSRSRERVMLLHPVEAVRCSGACTHAFGLTKWKTGGFLSYMDKLRMPEDENVTSMYFDQLMQAYGEQVHKIWVLGSNLLSPQERNHIGMVFQDRTHYPSVINTREPIR